MRGTHINPNSRMKVQMLDIELVDKNFYCGFIGNYADLPDRIDGP